MYFLLEEYKKYFYEKSKVSIDFINGFWYSNRAPYGVTYSVSVQNAMIREIAGIAWSLPRSMSGIDPLEL